MLGEQVEVHLMLGADTPRPLTSAILNLVLNARDAMAKGGNLAIETGNVVLDDGHAAIHGDVTAGKYVMVAVIDSGHGIPAVILDNVFEPFFTTKDVGKGSGLGLSMVYGFIKQSNGHIRIESEEGRGTTVRIYLPQAIGIAEPVEPAGTSSIEGGRNHHPPRPSRCRCAAACQAVSQVGSCTDDTRRPCRPMHGRGIFILEERKLR